MEPFSHASPKAREAFSHASCLWIHDGERADLMQVIVLRRFSLRLSGALKVFGSRIRRAHFAEARRSSTGWRQALSKVL